MKGFLFILLFIVTQIYAFDINSTASLSDILRNSQGEIVTDFSQKSFPIKGTHKKLGLDCKDCHKEGDVKEYSSAMNESCLKCHGSYAGLAQATGALGHNDNIHANPHYESLDCDTCHKAHKPTVNMCLRCHTQESMKKLVVK